MQAVEAFHEYFQQTIQAYAPVAREDLLLDVGQHDRDDLNLGAQAVQEKVESNLVVLVVLIYAIGRLSVDGSESVLVRVLLGSCQILCGYPGVEYDQFLADVPLLAKPIVGILCLFGEQESFRSYLYCFVVF